MEVRTIDAVDLPRALTALWGVVAGGALLAWGLAEAMSRTVWRLTRARAR
jgi:hypothetical protein